MRGKKAKIRQTQPDVRYSNILVSRFINKIMLDGKKSTAQKLFYKVIESAAKDLNIEPIVFVNTVVDNLRPALEIKARRVGGANYSVPIPVTPRRQEALAIRWVVDVTRAKTGDTFDVLLKREMVDAYNRIGGAIEKKNGVEKMAEANKAFAHFKW